MNSSAGEKYGTILRQRIIDFTGNKKEHRLLIAIVATLGAVIMSLFKNAAQAFILAARILTTMFTVYKMVTYPAY